MKTLLFVAAGAYSGAVLTRGPTRLLLAYYNSMRIDPRGSAARRRPTVKDVARQAGVSPSTVSNVLHDRPYVAPDKRAAVEAAILAVGYRPSLAGRQLRNGRSDILALAIPDIRSPYYAELAHIINREARKHGFTLLVDETGGKLEREREIARGYPDHGIDGIIFCPISIEKFDDSGVDVPIVLLGEHRAPKAFNHIAIDSTASAREAVAHLLSNGRRKFAFIGHQPQLGPGPGFYRLAGLRAELATAGLLLDESLILVVSEYSREEGQRAAEEVVRRKGEVDAVVCAADLLAIGAMRTLQFNGVTIPDDVAILGWDDSPEGRFSWPSLTTVKHDLEAIAALAVGSIVSQLEDSRAAPQHHVVRHELLIRESTRT